MGEPGNKRDPMRRPPHRKFFFQKYLCDINAYNSQSNCPQPLFVARVQQALLNNAIKHFFINNLSSLKCYQTAKFKNSKYVRVKYSNRCWMDNT